MRSLRALPRRRAGRQPRRQEALRQHRAAPLSAYGLPRVYELHHLGYQNIGDRECVPLSRFRRLWSPRYEVLGAGLHSQEMLRLENELIVIGGGGVLNPFDWPWIVLSLLERGNRVIAWGIGHHHDHVHYPADEIGDWRSSTADYAERYPLDQLWMASVRDAGTPFELVPDSSCMAREFDRSYEVTDDVVIFDQATVGEIPIDLPRRMSNIGDAPLADVCAFLASGRCVITNSYHGAYWATLLGREVLVYEPWNSKWLLTPWPLVTCDRENWREQRMVARSSPWALADARLRNIRFARRVFRELDLAVGGPKISPARGARLAAAAAARTGRTLRERSRPPAQAQSSSEPARSANAVP